MTDLEKVKERVERILEGNPKSRDSYKWLVYLIWREYCEENGFKIFIPFQMFSALPSTESITRAARKIQNQEGRFPPSKHADRLRKKEEDNYIQFNRS